MNNHKDKHSACAGSNVASPFSWSGEEAPEKRRECLSIRAEIKKCNFYVNVMTNFVFFISRRVWEKIFFSRRETEMKHDDGGFYSEHWNFFAFLQQISAEAN